MYQCVHVVTKLLQFFNNVKNSCQYSEIIIIHNLSCKKSHRLDGEEGVFTALIFVAASDTRSTYFYFFKISLISPAR